MAADLNGDGYTDLYVTTASYDKLLWNDGDGTFTEGAAAAGIDSFGWHAGAAVADVNGDGRPDLFVAGYTDLNAPSPDARRAASPRTTRVSATSSTSTKATTSGGRRGSVKSACRRGSRRPASPTGSVRCSRTSTATAGPTCTSRTTRIRTSSTRTSPGPAGLAADPAGLGFRFDERAAAEGVADPYAGMGIAAGDYDGDGRTRPLRDQLPSRAARRLPPSRGRTRARRSPMRAPRSRRPWAGRARPAGARRGSTSRSTGGPDLVLANGDVPITSLAKRRRTDPVCSRAVAAARQGRRFANVGGLGLGRIPRVNGRGLAVADYDNNGTMDIAVELGRRSAAPAPKHAAGPATGSRCGWRGSPRCRRDGRAAGRSQARAGAACRQQLPLVGGSARALRPGRRDYGCARSSVRYPGGREARLSDVAADRIVVVGTAHAPPPASRPRAARVTSPSGLHARSASRSLGRPRVERGGARA